MTSTLKRKHDQQSSDDVQHCSVQDAGVKEDTDQDFVLLEQKFKLTRPNQACRAWFRFLGTLLFLSKQEYSDVQGIKRKIKSKENKGESITDDERKLVSAYNAFYNDKSVLGSAANVTLRQVCASKVHADASEMPVDAETTNRIQRRKRNTSELIETNYMAIEEKYHLTRPLQNYGTLQVWYRFLGSLQFLSQINFEEIVQTESTIQRKRRHRENITEKELRIYSAKRMISNAIKKFDLTHLDFTDICMPQSGELDLNGFKWDVSEDDGACHSEGCSVQQALAEAASNGACHSEGCSVQQALAEAEAECTQAASSALDELFEAGPPCTEYVLDDILALPELPASDFDEL